VLHKGRDEDFIVFVDSVAELNAWKKDRSIPLVHKQSLQDPKMIANRGPGSSRFRLQNHDLTQVCLGATSSQDRELGIFPISKQVADVLQSGMAHKECWMVHLRLR
jgi:hypothetical protein